MLKFTIRSYLYSLKWIFIPLLIILACLVPACAIFMVKVKGQIGAMTNSLSSEFSTISCNVEDLVNFVLSQAKSLPWKTPARAIEMIVKEDFISNSITEFLEKTNENAYTVAMQGNIKETASQIQANFSIFPIAIIAGMLIAYLFTASFLRKKTCPRSIWKTILNVLVDLFFSATLVTVVVYLLGKWVESVFITSLVTALLYGFISITEAYIAHKDEKMKYRDIVNAKSVIFLLLSYIMIMAFSVILIALLFLLPYKLISLSLSLPIIIITFIDYNLAAETYVTSKRKDYKKLKKLQ